MNEKIPLSKGGNRTFFQYLNPHFEFECVRMVCLLYKFVSVCVLNIKVRQIFQSPEIFEKKIQCFFDFIIVCPNCIIQFGEVGWS
jgi:hypothetical protein